MKYQTIACETIGRVGRVKLNRPEVLNALSSAAMLEILDALETFDASDEIGCMVITGSPKAFAAGADIAEMARLDEAAVREQQLFADWDRLAKLRKPVIAGVSGYALGGGCELALMCDLIIAADNAKFGQPEVKLGIVTGMGGSQRLVRAIGKAKAMDMCLTGRMMDAKEAEMAGLVARVVPLETFDADVMDVATTIAGLPGVSIMSTKHCINQADENHLREGLVIERDQFYSQFGTADRREGMQAFLERRPPSFTHG